MHQEDNTILGPNIVKLDNNTKFVELTRLGQTLRIFWNFQGFRAQAMNGTSGAGVVMKKWSPQDYVAVDISTIKTVDYIMVKSPLEQTLEFLWDEFVYEIYSQYYQIKHHEASIPPDDPALAWVAKLETTEGFESGKLSSDEFIQNTFRMFLHNLEDCFQKQYSYIGSDVFEIVITTHNGQTYMPLMCGDEKNAKNVTNRLQKMCEQGPVQGELRDVYTAQDVGSNFQRLMNNDTWSMRYANFRGKLVEHMASNR